WNGCEVLRACLRSLAEANYPALDVVVVDNGSSDGSCHMVRTEFPDVVLIRNQENLGFCVANNQGVATAFERKNEYVLILNNDTVMHPECIRRLVARAQAEPDAAAVSPKIYFCQPRDRIWFAGGTFSLWTGCNGHVGYQEQDKGAWNAPKSMNFICACAMLVSRRAWQEVGGFDELLFRSAEDIDWSLRARRAGFRLLYEPEAIIWHRESFDILRNEGRGRQFYFYTRNRLAVMWKHANRRQWLTFLPGFALRCVKQVVSDVARGKGDTASQIPRAFMDFIRLRRRLQRWPRDAHAVYNLRDSRQQWRRAWRERNLQRELELCRHRELRRHLASALSAVHNPVIVEAGCGNGAWVAYLQEDSRSRVIGVDNYLPALQELKRQVPQSAAVAGDVRHMPFPDGFADVCISLGVVEHFPGGPQQVLTEMCRVLRPGGLLFLTVPYYNWLRRLFIHPLRAAYMAGLKRVRRRSLHFVEYRFTREGITHSTAAAGLQVRQVATDEYDRAEAALSLGLYVDLPAFRGNYPGELNWLGRVVRTLGNAVNPWLISGGVLVVAQKQAQDAGAAIGTHELLAESLA
ncbi:MAG TPA: glycosyltransferase, partial [Terriglobales bacterium]|nr:glycosyltransferase [Terriglobales bacterium]